MMNRYNLGFMSDEDFFEHVKNTVIKYRFQIDLCEFNKNLIDPIKLTFDSKVYRRDIDDVVESEIIRQLDKSNTNQIGYFHQNIFKYIGKGWIVPSEGWDVVNESQHIYVEMKNKHNTMNSSSSKNTYIRMQNMLIKNPTATCLLVEIISPNSQNINWVITIDNKKMCHQNIRRVSVDKFYEIVTGDKFAFKKLCEALPRVIENVVSNVKLDEASNTVLSELKLVDKNLLKSLYLLSFKKYEGFCNFLL